MELPTLKITRDRHRNVSFEINDTEDDFSDLPSGEYALVKIESLNDKIAVEEFIENLKNK